MINFGNVPLGSVLPVMFTTYGKTNGESITLSGLAVTDIEIYKGTSVTQRASDAGYALLDTDGIDIDSITGLHGFSIDTGDNTDAGFFTAGSFYNVVVSAVTVDSQTVNFIAATFRLVAQESVAGVVEVDVTHWLGTAAATPTVAGVPEVDVTHWIGTAAATPTTAGVPEVDVTFWLGTAAQGASGRPQVDVELWLGSAPNALASGRVDASVGAMAANVMTAAAAAADLTTELQSGLATAAALSTVDGKIDTIDTNVDAILVDTAEIGAAGAGLTAAGITAAGVRTAVGLASANLDTQLAALPTAGENADAVWEEAIADHSGTAGSTAEQLAAAGAAGDPWATALPGAYGAGTAGKIVGDNLNATVSSRLASASYTAPDNASIAAILADTGTDGVIVATNNDKTGYSVSGTVDANMIKINNVTVNGTGVLGDEWGP